MNEYFQTFGRYNAWANGRLFDACAALSAEAYLAERPAFFGSIHGNLNHILVGDRAWMARLEEVASGIKSLDETLYDNFDALRAAREEEDARIVAFVDSLTAERLGQDLHYKSVAGDPFVTPVRYVLAHLLPGAGA